MATTVCGGSVVVSRRVERRSEGVEGVEGVEGTSRVFGNGGLDGASLEV